YRLRRKQFMDSLAALSAALLRMQDEPASKRRAVEEIHQFVLKNYLVASQIAAIRLLLRNHAEALPRDAVNHWLEQACDQACRMLGQARQALDSGLPADAAAPAATSADADDAWPGWQPLKRRTRLLDADVRQIVLQAGAIARALKAA
ncbi:MAG: FUSC family protein, partial [Burkholderiaceae bacterium]